MTAPSPFSGCPSWPISTASPSTSCCPSAKRSSPSSSPPRIILDLEKLQDVPREQGAPLLRYAATIQSQRGDYNGRVLSIRHEDLRSLAVIYDENPTTLTEQLINWGVLSPDARRAVETV